MAEKLDPSMLPNWLRGMDDGPSVRPVRAMASLRPHVVR